MARGPDIPLGTSCSAECCDRARAKGDPFRWFEEKPYCKGHFRQLDRGAPLAPVRELGWSGHGVDSRCGSDAGFQAAKRAKDADFCIFCRTANRAYRLNRRARGLGVPGEVTGEQLLAKKELFPAFPWEDYGVGAGKWHWDHTVSLRHEGSNTIDNLTPRWGNDNIAKGAEDPKVWELEKKHQEEAAWADLHYERRMGAEALASLYAWRVAAA